MKILQTTLSETKQRLLPLQIGKQGRLQEWSKDFEDEDVHHRHVSHLVGVYPGRLITEQSAPDLFQAAKKSLEIRGDGGTGWSLGWKIGLWARFKDGNRAERFISNLLTLVKGDESIQSWQRRRICQSVRCASSFPNRRKLCRDSRDRRDAAAIASRIPGAPAGAARCLERWVCQRIAGQRRIRSRFGVEERRIIKCSNHCFENPVLQSACQEAGQDYTRWRRNSLFSYRKRLYWVPY